jgi:tetratricopeptide (TPR) repeat protein
MKRLLITLVVAAVHWPFLIGRAYAQPPEKPVVPFRDVRIFDGTSDRLVEGMDVLVEGNKTAKIFESISLAQVFGADIGYVRIAAADCAGGDPAKGIPACTRIIERAGEPSDRLADAYNNRGKLYVVQNQIERALADLNEALRRNPRHADARHNRGAAYLMSGQNDKALADFREAVL